MTAVLEPTDFIEVISAEPWRVMPHDFGEHVSEGRWRAWPHLAYVGERIADAMAEGGARLIINMPPGHGKSSLLSQWVPVWLLDNMPQRRIILASHGAELASHWGRTVRNQFERNPLLRTKLSEDSSAADRWNTPQGGGMVTTGVGGGITGWRGNDVFIDDPHPTFEAVSSSVHRERVKEWFGGTLYDRTEPGGNIIVLMHRWHEDDLAGFLIEYHNDPWQVIRLPALAEKADPLGREEGEALCPQRFGKEELLQIQGATPAPIWDAKYQQAPQSVGGGRVYAHFMPDRNEDKGLTLRDNLPLNLSLDFNYNPGMHAEIGQYDPAADLLTAVHEVHGAYMRLDDMPGKPGTGCLSSFMRLVDGLRGGKFPWPELWVFGDPAGHQNRAETTQTAWQLVQSRLTPWAAGYGKRVVFKVPRGQYPVRTRVETFNEALSDSSGYVHYKINPLNCPRLLADFKYLKADPQGLVDKTDEKLSHATEAEANRVCWLRPVRKMTIPLGRPASIAQPA
jgi:hypothetical protein